MQEGPKTQDGMWGFLARHPKKSTAGIAGPVIVVSSWLARTAGFSLWLGVPFGLVLAAGLYKKLSRRVVDVNDDTYNNIFVTAARLDKNDPSRLAVTGYLFLPRNEKTPIAFRREFSILAADLLARGIDPQTIGSQGEKPTHLLSITTRGRYWNLGFRDRTTEIPTATAITNAYPLIEVGQEWYASTLQSVQRIRFRTLLFGMKAFDKTLAPSGPGA